MKSVDWHAILDSHPLFQSLDRQERKLLVSEPFSKEHKYREGSVILEEGETGNSLFLIGAGAVSVVLHGLHDEAVKLYTLREGELFGEMALIEQRPRSATVVAAEPSTVLELNGDRFLPLMQKHHEIALYLLAKLSQRLRHIDDEILIRRVKGLDETLNILNNRVDAIVQATDAKLAASQAMFDETNQRAHEIIDSAERARSRLGWALGFASSVLSLLVAIGVWNHMATQRDVKDIEREVKDDAKQVADMRETVQREAKVTQDQAKVTQDAATRAQDAASKAEGSASKVEGFEKTAKDYTNKTATLSKDVAELHKKSGEALDGIMFAALQADIGQNKVNDRTVESYTTTVSSKHKPIQDQLFETMHDVILGGGASTIKTIGSKSLDNLKGPEGHSAVITTYYFIILSDIVSYDKEAFNEDLKSLDEYIAANKGAFENPFRLNEKNIQDVIELVKQTEQMSERQGMKSKMLSDLFAKLAQAS